MYLNLTPTLAFPDAFIDANRMTPNAGPNGGKVSARVWVALAFVLTAVVWQVVRLIVER